MRIIHTADWHLCDRLGRLDRSDDLMARVRAVADLCEQHAVDVLLIAGDLFFEQASIENMTQALTLLHEAFAPFFNRGGTILSITGNHDRDVRIEMLRAGMRLADPLASSRRFLPGRMYLLNRPYFGTLTTQGDERAQFILIPYPTASRYARPDDKFRSKEEENRVLQMRVLEEIQAARRHADFDPKLPTILIAHLCVSGGEVHTLYKLTERDDVLFEVKDLPTALAYVALGHIHKPQCLGGLSHVRYPGSIDRLDFGERTDEKGVVLLDLGPAGLRGEPVWLPIAATPMHVVTIADSTIKLAPLAQQYPDRETAIVRVEVTHDPAGPSRDEISHELRRLFPRHTEIAWVKPDTPAGSQPAGLYKPQSDSRTTIRDFLAKELVGDPDKDDLLALAEKFLAEEAAS